jgi:hypothetical protein
MRYMGTTVNKYLNNTVVYMMMRNIDTVMDKFMKNTEVDKYERL